MKFNQWVDKTAEQIEVARAVNFADLAEMDQLKTHYSLLQSQNTIYFNKIFVNGKQFTIRRLDWRYLINGDHLTDSFVESFGKP